MLRPNEHGGFIIRQSDLSAWERCQQQAVYYQAAKADPTAPQGVALSATVYGTVVHYAMLNMEKLHHEGDEDALDVGIATFLHYWDPENIEQIAEKIDRWLPRQTYGSLRDRGREAITTYYKLLTKEDSRLLGLEYQFTVPLLGIDGRQHTLTGTVDRLSIKRFYGTPYISIDDFKTGKQPTYLRYHIQGTCYAYASLQPEFWQSEQHPSFDDATLAALERAFAGNRYKLHDGTRLEDETITEVASRRFRWINLQTVKFADGGWRGPIDYERMRTTVTKYVDAHESNVFSLNLTGEICVYCPFNDTCTGLGIADEDHGAPSKRYSTREKASA
jgi:hypothetical protein